MNNKIPFIKSGKDHFKALSQVVDANRIVHVYKNLHKKCWSIRQSGKVVAHANYICLTDCRFVVNQKGRRKVINERRKNVHATIRGKLFHAPSVPDDTEGGWFEITYNPYIHERFYNLDTCEYVYGALFVDMEIDGMHPQLTPPVMAKFI